MCQGNVYNPSTKILILPRAKRPSPTIYNNIARPAEIMKTNVCSMGIKTSSVVYTSGTNQISPTKENQETW